MLFDFTSLVCLHQNGIGYLTECNMTENKDKLRFSPAHIAGICLLSTAFVLSLVRIEFAALPLTGFLGLCAVAPFFPKLEFFLPVINRGKTGKKAVAITFDDGPDPVSTPFLLDLLSEQGVHATFFINGGKAARYPALIRRILREGHCPGQPHPRARQPCHAQERKNPAEGNRIGATGARKIRDTHTRLQTPGMRNQSQIRESFGETGHVCRRLQLPGARWWKPMGKKPLI